jgi:hypothetical protein
MTLDYDLERLARDLGADFYGVADLTTVRDEVLRQGGEEPASYPRAISIGIRLFDEIVDGLPRREEDRAVSINYLHHCYDVVNERLDRMASRLASVLQGKGHRVLPLPSSERFDSERICAQFSHKLAARTAGLGWIGRSCLLITPEAGPRARWNRLEPPSTSSAASAWNASGPARARLSPGGPSCRMSHGRRATTRRNARGTSKTSKKSTGRAPRAGSASTRALTGEATEAADSLSGPQAVAILTSSMRW